MTGAQRTYGGLVNVLYDMNLGLPVFPYVGAGVGYEIASLNRHFYDAYNGTISGSKGSFAYQFIGGLAYPLAAIPGLSLTAEYRFEQLVATRSYVETYLGTSYKETIGQESSHTFLLGLRYQLFTPPVAAPIPAAAPMAAPAPAPAKTYLVFFDWNKYNLTPRATQIIAQATSDSKTNSVTTLDVSGYTDTSGTPTYNQGLSERRAKSVAAKLVADGVPASEIAIHSFGETHLLVPTGPGVREPQNRRVEVVLN
ncbi:MAG: OmpA family protein [Acidocella sp.]|nr:OmpA family protein [Acidocella sp.]